jgi:aerobic carbon-monoxide dehydrogenase small subunit
MSNIITVNNRPIQVSDEDKELTLLHFLRERQFLHGVKNGCEKGVCGSCTVALDDKAVRSCKIKVEKAIGKQVITIEGMEYPNGKIHPLQQAFIDAGAVQCGFCTPGMIMSSYILLLHNSKPSREEIRKALRGNLCRCTGYQQIVDAVQLAATYIEEQGLSPKAGCLSS